MGMYAFVSAGGGSIGLLAGGALTQSLSWHWIFFVNVPIGVFAFVLGSALIEENEGIGLAGGVDVARLGSDHARDDAWRLRDRQVDRIRPALGAHARCRRGRRWLLLGGFFWLESRISNPIMPLRILRLRMLMGSSLVRGLLVTGMFSAFFLGALYLERVLGYDAIDTGLAFMPLTIAIAAMSMGRRGEGGRALRPAAHARGRSRRDRRRPAAARRPRASTRATSPACSSRSWRSGSARAPRSCRC